MRMIICAPIVALCSLTPTESSAQDVKAVPAIQAVAVQSSASESSSGAPVAAENLLVRGQDKQNLPYDQAPEAKTQVQPKYPDLATLGGIEGTVWTRVFIDETGKVTKVEVTKSDAEILNQPSIDAAMQWAFKPAMKNGKAIATEVTIPFRFKLQKGPLVPDYTQPGWTPLSVLAEPRGGYRVMNQIPYLIGQSPTQSNTWYPESALKDRFEGMVLLKLTINVGGRVERVEVMTHAREDVDSAAVHLARTWTFTPGQWNGMPEKSVIQVPVSFYLGRQAK